MGPVTRSPLSIWRYQLSCGIERVVPATSVTDQTTQDFAHLIAGFMQQMFPRLAQHKLDHLMMASGLVGACTRVTTQWVVDKCRTPLEDVLRNVLMLFHATIAHARTLDQAAAKQD